MTLQQFSPIFALLAVQLRATDADEATIRGYYQALKDLEPEFVAEAAQRLARTVDEDGKSWFPKAPEWRAAASKVEVDRQEQQRAYLRKLRTPLCLACGDTGWADVEDGPYVRKCSCRTLRRLEVLGRRPYPALPEASGDGI